MLPVPRMRDIGECIYCGSVAGPLQREHAIPYGLNGEWTLLRASCSACANVTHRFERDTLRCLFLPIRAVLDMRTRHRHERPRRLPVVIESRGETRTIELPRTEYPLYLPVPRFPPPGALVGRPRTPEMPTEMTFLHIAGPTFQEVAERYSADFVGARLNFAPTEFARTLAKIAYAAAVYALGIRPFKNADIRRVILGQDPCVSHWVGSSHLDEMNPPTGHQIQVRASGSDLHVFLRLFAKFGAPEYLVVLGQADPDFVNSDDWPFK